MTPRIHGRLAAGVLLSVLLLGGCAGLTGDDSSGGTNTVEAEAPGLATDEAVEPDIGSGSSAERDGAALKADDAVEAGSPEQDPTQEQMVISTARVVLEADDVVKARDAVTDVVAGHRGSIDFEETSGSEEARRAELVVRVPAASFGDVLTEIGEVAEVVRTTRQAEDVTTQVIDNRARIRAQERSIRQIELLLDRATSIRDIITIERQLARRQAKLDSLKQRRAYLADQTSMATITVRIEHIGGVEPDDDERGFLPGLRAGWHALVAVVAGLLTGIGAALPFLGVLLPLVALGWLLGGRLRRSGLVTGASAPSSTSANAPSSTSANAPSSTSARASTSTSAAAEGDDSDGRAASVSEGVETTDDTSTS